MWNLAEIENAITTTSSPLAESSYLIPLWDPDRNIGVGHTADGKQILILPADSKLMGFEKKFAEFSPWTSAYWLEQELSLEKIAVLTCKFDMEESRSRQAVAGVFFGLLEVNELFGSAGESIWALSKLFDDGTFSVDPKGLVGLIGELLVILTAEDKSSMVKTWHSDPSNKFDFSWEKMRVEVKSTMGTSREHNFSSFQIPGPEGTVVRVASVLIEVAEVGSNLGDLINEVTRDLEPELASKVLRQCLASLSVFPYSITRPVFDLQTSMKSIRYFDSSAIPAPVSVPGVLEMKWKATLEQIKAIDRADPSV